jgi:hypothetical protein
MLENLMTPGGRIGFFTVAVAFLMAASGIVGIILAASGVIERDSERIGAVIVGCIALIGALGLSMQPSRPLMGGVLAVVGSVAAALLNSWLIFPVLLVPATIVLVVMRARRLSGEPHGVFGQRAV